MDTITVTPTTPSPDDEPYPPRLTAAQRLEAGLALRAHLNLHGGPTVLRKLAAWLEAPVVPRPRKPKLDLATLGPAPAPAPEPVPLETAPASKPEPVPAAALEPETSVLAVTPQAVEPPAAPATVEMLL